MENKQRSNMRAFRIREFVKKEESIPWLVEGLLPSIGWTLFIGMKGIGKTTFAMQLASAVQDGKDFLGKKTVQTDIMFIQADSGSIEWKFILKRVAPISPGWTVIDVPVRCFGNPSYVKDLKNIIGKVQPGFIVFDSLYKLTSENINTESILRTIEAMNILCEDKPWLLIHHPPHGEVRASGHNSLGGSCSNEWHLLRNKLKVEKGRLVPTQEIMLSRDTSGLWCLKEETVQIDENVMNRRL